MNKKIKYVKLCGDRLVVVFTDKSTVSTKLHNKKIIKPLKRFGL
jgi:hypothetical protein